nr:hypothetical protein [Tanacetum cinerariifolium]
MAILVVMLNDDIKAYAEYLEYLAKSGGVAPVKTRVKGLLTKQGVEINMERVSIHKRRRSKTVTEEVGQYKGINDDEVNYEETKEDKEPLVKTRPRGIAIGGEAHRESKEERVNHSKKLKGLETGAGVTLEVLNEPSDYSCSSSFDSKFDDEDISSDEAEVTKKANDAKIVDVKKYRIDQVAEKQEKPSEPRPPLVDTTVTLIPDKTTILPTQPPPTQPKRRKTKVILRKSNKPDSQVESGELECRVTRLVLKVYAMSNFNLPEAIDKSVKALLKKILPKDVPYCGKIKLEKAKKSMQRIHQHQLIKQLLMNLRKKTNEILSWLTICCWKDGFCGT